LNSTQIGKATLAGIVSGIFLGLILKLVEYVTGLKVYTLLLNVDYVPVLRNYETTELGEFVLHLMISIMLALTLQSYLQTKEWDMSKKKKFITLLSIAVGIILYPTTMLSERTPELTNIYAFLSWIIAHAVYGKVLAYILERQNPLTH
jgi:hypothetical protein